MRFFLKFLLCAVAFLSYTGISLAGISVVVLTGQAAPGVTNASFSTLSRAAVNNSGEMAFQAGLSNGGSGIFKLSYGQLSVVALSGQSIAGASPGLTFGTMGYPVINDSGTIAFSAAILGGVSNLRGIFVASGTSVNKVLDSNTTIPGTDQITGGIYGPLQLNNKGDIAVAASIGTSGTPSVLVISNGVVSLVISEATYFSLNNNGDIAFGNGPNLNLYSAGKTQLVAQTGQSVSNSDVPLGQISSPAMNDQQDIFFSSGDLSGSFSTLPPNTLFRWHSGSTDQIVSFDDPVPGVSNSGFWHMYAPVVDNSGKAFFTSYFYLNNNLTHGLFMYDGGNIVLLAKDGQVVQGVGTFTAISSPGANDFGIVTFVSDLDNGNTGIFQLYALMNQILFPEVADGASNSLSWHTTLMLSNGDNSGSASVSVSFFNDDGTPMNVGIQGVTNSVFAFTIPASGSLNLETNGQGNLKTGWARVQADKSLSGISIFSSYDSTGNCVGEVGAPGIAGQSSFSFFVQSQAEINAAVSLANPNSAPALVTLTLRDSQGSVQGASVNWSVPANGRKAKYLTELFPQAPNGFQGTIEAVSSLPIVPMGMRQRKLVFTWLPLIP